MVCLRCKESQLELAHLNFVSIGKRNLFYALAIVVSAVERGQVFDRESFAVSNKFGVLARNGYVVKKNVCVRVSSGGGDILVEKKARTLFVAWVHNQKRVA